MEKLNELVELAKKATPGRNHDRLDSCGGGIKYQCLGDDGSLVLQCDHKNDEYGFIGPKSLEDEAFFLACKPEIILAIAEAYSVLERRAETAESEAQRLNATAQPVKLPTTRLWAGKVDCYSKEDVISMLKSLGLEVSE